MPITQDRILALSNAAYEIYESYKDQTQHIKQALADFKCGAITGQEFLREIQQCARAFEPGHEALALVVVERKTIMRNYKDNARRALKLSARRSEGLTPDTRSKPSLSLDDVEFDLEGEELLRQQYAELITGNPGRLRRSEGPEQGKNGFFPYVDKTIVELPDRTPRGKGLVRLDGTSFDEPPRALPSAKDTPSGEETPLKETPTPPSRQFQPTPQIQPKDGSFEWESPPVKDLRGLSAEELFGSLGRAEPEAEPQAEPKV